MKRETGFTLIEILIVVGIVLILAIIAIPNMMRSKSLGNEASAIAAMKTLSNACNLYTFTYNNFPLPTGDPGFSALSSSSGQLPYVNFDYSNPKDGYDYTYNNPGAVANPNFTIISRPLRFRVTGVRSFYVDSTGLIRYCDTAQNCALSGTSPEI